MTKPIDLIGRRFGRLVVLARASNSATGKARFLCRCDCGEETTTFSGNLREGKTISCGCWRGDHAAKKFSTHRMSRTKEHRCWTALKNRCLNPKNKAFPRYGGRGITICPEWIKSFEAFFRDMGPKPGPKHSIERADNDGNYCKGNCSWELSIVQNNNRTTVYRIEFEGVTDSIAGWSRRIGMSGARIRRRLIEEGIPMNAIVDQAKDAAVRARLP